MRTKIRVFPDYMSTGLWDYPVGSMVDEDEIDHCIPAHLLVALKYWVRTWEFIDSFSPEYMQEFKMDGQVIVDAMNACQDEFEFIFVGEGC